MDLATIRKSVDRLKGRRDQVQEDLNKNILVKDKLTSDIKDSEEAQRIIQHVAKLTQQQLEYRISAPVSMALAGVFDDPYKFDLKFEVRRGQTEADLIFSRNGHIYKDLVFSGGGGAVDVAAWGLQIAAWGIKGTRPFILADEPLKWLKSRNKVLEERGALMIKEISHQLGLQVLMISHITEQQEGSDRIFELAINNDGVTEIEVIK